MKWKSKKLKDMTETELNYQKKIAYGYSAITFFTLLVGILYCLVAGLASNISYAAMLLGITGACFSVVAFYTIDIVAISFELRIRELKQ